MNPMSAAVDKVYEQVKQLSDAEQQELIERMANDDRGLRLVKAGTDPLAEMDAAERAELEEALDEGLADIEAGRVHSADELLAELRA